MTGADRFLQYELAVEELIRVGYQMRKDGPPTEWTVARLAVREAQEATDGGVFLTAEEAAAIREVVDIAWEHESEGGEREFEEVDEQFLPLMAALTPKE